MTTDLPTISTSGTSTPVSGSAGAPDALAYLVGAFDMLNVAHLSLVDQVRAQCDRLVVGVLTDAEVEALNQQAPVFPLDERVTIVSHLRDVDEAIVHSPQWVAEHPGARVYALTERDDIDVDEVIAALELPTSEVLRAAVTLTYPAGTTAARTPGGTSDSAPHGIATKGETR